MWSIATDSVAWSVCVCVGDDREPCKNAEPIEMPYGADWCGPRELCIIEGGAHWCHQANTVDDYVRRWWSGRRYHYWVNLWHSTKDWTSAQTHRSCCTTCNSPPVEGDHARLSPNRHGLNMACGGKDRQNGLFRRLYWLEMTVRQISLRTAFVD